MSGGRRGPSRPTEPEHFPFIWQKSGKEVASEAQAILALDGAGTSPTVSQLSKV